MNKASLCLLVFGILSFTSLSFAKENPRPNFCLNKLNLDDSAKTQVIEEIQHLFGWGLHHFAKNRGIKLKPKFTEIQPPFPNDSKTKVTLELQTLKDNTIRMLTQITTEAESMKGTPLQISYTTTIEAVSFQEKDEEALPTGKTVCLYTAYFVHHSMPELMNLSQAEPISIGKFYIDNMLVKLNF